MKFVSWNVNGLRACMNKGFADFFNDINADIFAIQETKMQEEQKSFAFDGYKEIWNSAEKKGYSGTLIYSKLEPLEIVYGIDNQYYLDEGRIITLEFDDFYFVNVYVPNSQRGLTRLSYRMEFDENFRNYLKRLDEKKPVIACGDFNVAHNPIDIRNPASNERNAGYTIEERTQFQKLMESGFIDSFRYLYPDKVQYTWWSYMFNARANNVGWRIDYFILSERLASKMKNSIIRDEIYGSDHCPVVLEIF
ncbi:MAG TPA: exodeoxyribonuclease III [Bacilli bacterium]|jgi:exodeoxyribonuclease-3|nr:exodeoxyribonuclease III [Acholeplasmataceae bacterium]HOA78181.1 exodeoxyribonuclease III [Bacilli bacterium]